MVSQGVIYSCPPSCGRCQGQAKPCDPKAQFIAECRQVTQTPECFLCKILKISFCCGQLGVFRANKQQTGHLLHRFPVANIRGLQLSWDHFFLSGYFSAASPYQDEDVLIIMLLHNMLGELIPAQQK